MKTDHELMMRVRDGRVAALGDLFDRHHERLFNFFLRLTGDRSASEDLLQDVFVRILKYRHTYRDDGDFVTWLYRLARNAGNDRFRRVGREPREVVEEAAAGVACERDLPSLEVESAESVALLRSALDRLPRDKRELLLLARFQGLEYRQIGELLGCSVGAVKVRVHRAVKQLRDVYLQLQEVPS
jgi:RNA polymerase sigma-70 factor (ECF subfamily)